MKSVRPKRLNRKYACPKCGGFLAISGSKKLDMWVCIDCRVNYRGETLETEALELVKVKINSETGEVVRFEENITSE
jgi:ribosomal protein L37AE/L43A